MGKIRGQWLVGLVVLLSLVMAAAAATTIRETEAQKVVGRLLALPAVHAEAGFTARVLVPPGQLYDPADLRAHGDSVWLNDDGGEVGDKGSRLLALDRNGGLTVLADLGTLLPVVGFDIAPAGFGSYGGEIFSVAQARAGMAGATANHIIQRVTLQPQVVASTFCALPANGSLNNGIAGYGAEGRFGPDHSPFAGRFFAVTILNATIYQVTADGACTPFTTFDAQRVGLPVGLQFSTDHSRMLVSMYKSDAAGTAVPNAGAILRVRPDGTVEDAPFATGLSVPIGAEFAPQGFRAYAGELFVADAGDFTIPVPMTQPIANDGKIYRITSDGRPHLVASGLFNPSGVHFVGEALWVTDLNGDFIGGRRELPDGFVVEIRAAR